MYIVVADVQWSDYFSREFRPTLDEKKKNVECPTRVNRIQRKRKSLFCCTFESKRKVRWYCVSDPSWAANLRLRRPLNTGMARIRRNKTASPLLNIFYSTCVHGRLEKKLRKKKNTRLYDKTAEQNSTPALGYIEQYLSVTWIIIVVPRREDFNGTSTGRSITGTYTCYNFVKRKHFDPRGRCVHV